MNGYITIPSSAGQDGVSGAALFSPDATVMPTSLTFSPIRQDIASLSVVEIAKQFGTPTYVYDEAKIVERINDLRQFSLHHKRKSVF